MGNRSRSETVALALALAISAAEAFAAPGPADSLPMSAAFPPTPLSLGQPQEIRTTWGPLLGYSISRERPASRLYVDLAGPLLGPRVWWLDGAIEGAVGTTDRSADAAIGTWLRIPWFGAGAEYGFDDRRLTFALSLRFPERRGGMFRRGDMIRVDYRPERREILAGFALRSPFEKYRSTRPRQTGAALPRTRLPGRPQRISSADLPLEAERSLEAVHHSIIWLDRLLTPRFNPGRFAGSAEEYRNHIRQPGHTFREEEAAYHRGLDSAFTSVLGGDPSSGRSVAALAESILFREVLVPFNRTFGQEKYPRDAGGFCAAALAAFEKRLANWRGPAAKEDSVEWVRRAHCVEVFRQVLQTIQEASGRSGDRWTRSFLFWTSRGSLAWLPLNYGLRPEQYDTQEEWDAVLSALGGQPFTDANSIELLMMEQFHLELKRMIRATRDYQVTVIHDFRGLVPDGRTDLYGWDVVMDGYVTAFTRAIREFDEGRRDRLPQYFLFLDANYYQANRSRGIITYLENLYRPPPTNFEVAAIGEQVEAAHAKLLTAIKTSPALRGADERTLRNTFKVHVSITNPFDPSFMLDVTRRDHRKVAFRDVTEDYPDSGAAVITGEGVGEHYNGSGWEDRSLLVRGSSLVQLKTAARNLFLGQGFREREVPECLRPRPFPDDYAERCARMRASGKTTAVSFHMNDTGYGAKDATVFKAAIYNLAPPGSAILSYDSLWTSEFWTSMFISASLRGANMFPVGPVPENAPSDAVVTMHFLRENLRMMMEANAFFAEDLERAGGTLRVGLYDSEVPVQDFRRRTNAMLDGRKRHPSICEHFPLHPASEAFLEKFRAQYDEMSLVELRLRPRPLLHLKVQLFGTAEAFRVYRLAEWVPVATEHMRRRMAQKEGRSSEGITPAVLDAIANTPGARTLHEALTAHLDSLSADANERVILTLTTGSQNQDPRAMLLDGEVLVAVSGFDSLVAGIDFIFILSIVRWPSNAAEFDKLFREEPLPLHLKPFRLFLKDQN